MAGGTVLANLITKFTGDTSDLEGSAGKGQSAIGSFASSVAGHAQTAGKAVMGMGTVIAGAVAGVAAGLGKLAADSASLVTVKEAFEGIAESAGTSGAALLAAFDSASGGMVSMEDAMLAFNKASMLVSNDFAVQLPDAMGYLGKVAAATGQDVGFMLDSLVTGVGRLSPMILDNLGIQVNLTEAAKEWAAESGKAATSTINNSAAIADLSQKLGWAQTEYEMLTVKQQAAIEAEKDHASIDLQMDKKAAQIGKYQKELDSLSRAHGKTITDVDGLIKSMTKAEQQEAIMAQTMKKLAENTAAMPDVTQSAAGAMEAFQVKLKNTKDTLGMALVPAFGALIDVVSAVANVILPPLVEFFQGSLAPAIETVVGFISMFTGAIMDGVGPIDALRQSLILSFGGDIAAKIMGVVDMVQGFIDKIGEVMTAVQPAIVAVWGFVAGLVSLNDIMIVIGVLIASVVLPALVGILTAAAPVVAVIAALVAVVVLVRKAWEENFLGIQEIVGNALGWVQGFIQEAIAFIQEAVQIGLAFIQEFWAVHGETIIATAQGIWETIVGVVTVLVDLVRGIVETALSYIQDFWATHGDQIIAIAGQAWDMISTVITTVVDLVRGWIESGLTAIQDFWTTHGETILAAADAAWNAISQAIGVVLDVIQSLFAAFKSAFEGDWKGFGENLRAAWDTLWEGIKSAASGVFEWFKSIDWGEVGRSILQGIANGIKQGASIIKDAAINAAKAAWEAVKGFFGIGSPSRLMAETVGRPMAQGIAMGWKEEMGSLTRSIQGEVSAAIAPITGRLTPSGDSSIDQSQNLTMNVYTREPTNVIRQYRVMQAMLA